MQHLVTIFTNSCASVFAVTGFAKLVSSFGRSEILLQIDPITGLSFKYLMLFAGILEIIASGIIIKSNKTIARLSVIGWLSSSIFIYRIGLIKIGWTHPCSCLGTFTGLIHLPPKIADDIMKAILWYSLVGTIIASIFIKKWNLKQKEFTANP